MQQIIDGTRTCDSCEVYSSCVKLRRVLYNPLKMTSELRNPFAMSDPFKVAKTIADEKTSLEKWKKKEKKYGKKETGSFTSEHVAPFRRYAR